MSFSISKLTFSPSLVFFILGIVALVVIGGLCITAWKRSVRPVRTGLLESLRFLIAFLIVLMLWKPEWKTVIEPEDSPEIAILWDASSSMTTQDVKLPSWLDPEQNLTSRSECVEKILKSSVFVKKLKQGGTAKVFDQSFSATPDQMSPQQKQNTGSDLTEPLLKLAENHDNLQAIIMLTDGSHNINSNADGEIISPTTAAQKLLLGNTPLFTVPIGADKSLPDLDLFNIAAPDFGIVGEFVQIPFSIQSSLERDTRATVSLRNERGKTETKSIVIPAFKTYHGSMLWQLQKEGSSKLTISIPIAPEELNGKNNSQEFIINGKKESIRALVIETKPRWEYRFIRNALSRDPGVQVDCLLLHSEIGNGDGPDYIQKFPENLEELQKYDVVFLGDVGIGPNQLSKEQADLLAGLVKEQASGIVFIPGFQGNQATLKGSALEELIPVEVDPAKPKGINSAAPASLKLTKAGKRSLLTLLGESELENPKIWRALPGFYWCAAVEKVKAGAIVLASHSDRKNNYGSIPLLVTQQVGNGKALFLGHDSAWRWRRGVEDLYHFRFWKNVARWMSYQRNMAADERIRLYRTPDRPKLGQTVTLSANAFNSNGVPLHEGSVDVDILMPSGKKKTISLDSIEGKWGAFSGRFNISEVGEWKLTAKIVDDPSTKGVSTSIVALGKELEKTGKPTNSALLQEIATITKGRMIDLNQLDQMANIINSLPAKKPIEINYPLWTQLTLLITLIVLLALFWVGRKLNGTF